VRERTTAGKGKVDDSGKKMRVIIAWNLLSFQVVDILTKA
jgi:hypothetical protein